MIEKLNSLVIQTPEGVNFSLPVASPVIRCLALLLDVLFISALSTTIGTLFSSLTLLSSDLVTAAMIILYFILSIGYGVAMEWFWNGQSIGKKVFKLKVVDEEGLRLQFSQIVIRNLLRFVDSLPALYLVGGVTSLFNSKYQRIGDIVAGTVVMRIINISEPDLDQLSPIKFNSLKEQPFICSKIHKYVSPREASIALNALVRRGEIEPDKRVELFKELASYFQKSLPFTKEVSGTIPDEQYIRNIVDVLYGFQNKM
jgi:uncharacterized RDD family membrane protein YckC